MTERPKEHTEKFNMRVSPGFLALVDDWRRNEPDIPSRAEAIRRLVARGVVDFAPYVSICEQVIRKLRSGDPITHEDERRMADARERAVSGARLSLKHLDSLVDPESFSELSADDTPPSDT